MHEGIWAERKFRRTDGVNWVESRRVAGSLMWDILVFGGRESELKRDGSGRLQMNSHSISCLLIKKSKFKPKKQAKIHTYCSVLELEIFNSSLRLSFSILNADKFIRKSSSSSASASNAFRIVNNEASSCDWISECLLERSWYLLRSISNWALYCFCSVSFSVWMVCFFIDLFRASFYKE